MATVGVKGLNGSLTLGGLRLHLPLLRCTSAAEHISR